LIKRRQQITNTFHEKGRLQALIQNRSHIKLTIGVFLNQEISEYS
jgi:hypothetical protein